ncbi:hypothetical protein [Actinospica robiniae]|uniref:hypothetical protein n=1 Tax=Actinospica robiniae TaxID=304901 RepID=UPI000419B299|nr:hypothetical protein [Actinospica robiniae]
MLTPEEVATAKQMQARGWKISVIARHLHHDRRTVRDYLTGQRLPGVRHAGPDPLDPFAGYCQRRFADDPHLQASTLFEELVELGYPGAYSTFTRALRRQDLRPHCHICTSSDQPKPENREQ